MFETTAIGYRATDEAVAHWRSRDICPSCSVIVEPVAKTEDGRYAYRCDCNGPVEWTAFSPADTTGL